jgi:GH24 family phage-related lysozyme (muramidase)
LESTNCYELVLAITIYLDTDEDGIVSFSYNKGGGLFPNSTISRRLNELNIISKKVVSTEAE